MQSQESKLIRVCQDVFFIGESWQSRRQTNNVGESHSTREAREGELLRGSGHGSMPKDGAKTGERAKK